MSAYAIPVAPPRQRTSVGWLREAYRRAREATMVEATCTLGITDSQTTAATAWGASASFTPAANDLLVSFVAASGSGPSLSDSQGLGWTLIASASSGGSRRVFVFVANALAAASAMTVTTNLTSAGSGFNFVVRVSGMTRTGSGAVKQSITGGNGAASVPSLTFGSSALTGNPTLICAANSTNPATLTPPVGWTEQADVGNATVVGAEYATRNSGFTGTTMSWSGTSQAWNAAGIELDTTAGVKALAADVAGVGAVSPSASVTRRIGATPAGTSTVSAALRDNRTMATTIAGTSTVSPALRVTRRLGAAMAGTSTVTANFVTSALKSLATAIAGTSVVTAVINRSARLASSIAGNSAVSATMGSLAAPVVINEVLKRRRRMMRDGRWWSGGSFRWRP